MAVYKITIQLLSPISLGSGQGNVNIDADIVHDAYGMPYFPGRRFKGLLYESAVEAAEMAALSGMPIIDQASVDELFHHTDGDVRLIIPNFYLKEYDQMKEDWTYLQAAYPEYIRPEYVLKGYTSIRYQTQIDDDGTASEGSLRNIRVLEPENACGDPLVFSGNIEIQQEQPKYKEILALALQNISGAGMKRNRGFGQIQCTMPGQEKIIADLFQRMGY